jgi:hypothetical protein
VPIHDNWFQAGSIDRHGADGFAQGIDPTEIWRISGNCGEEHRQIVDLDHPCESVGESDELGKFIRALGCHCADLIKGVCISLLTGVFLAV